MTDVAVSTPPATPGFRPASTEALWQQISAPDSTVGKVQRLGATLVHTGLLTAGKLWAGLQAQQLERENGKQRLIGQILVDQGALTQEQLHTVMASREQAESAVHPGDLTPEAAALALVSGTVAERVSALPLLVREDVLVLLMSDPWDHALIDELRSLTRRRLIALQAAPDTLLPAICKAYCLSPRACGASAAAQDPAPATLQDLAPAGATARDLLASLECTESAAGNAGQVPSMTKPDSVLARLIDAVIDEAIGRHASDIHIEAEPDPGNLRIRLRIDGDLVTHLELPARYRAAVLARIRTMAGMDSARHRQSQDGKIHHARFGAPPVQLRVTAVPTSGGLEDLMLRLLTGPLALEHMGLSPPNLLALRAAVHKRCALVLVCGPTGCGKTSTLHSLLRYISGTGRKVWTVEDRIEITQEGLRQMQVNPRPGWTFAAAMRTLLRADPDVIMTDEIRDDAQACSLLEAALTGHLVLTTLATCSAPESIARQLESRLQPLPWSDLPLVILVQRLVRRLCTACREPRLADQDALMELAWQYLDSGGHHPSSGEMLEASNTVQARNALIEHWRQQHADAQGQLHLWRSSGCPQCDGNGYHGRLGLHELMLRDPTARHPGAAPVADRLTLRQDGMEKVLRGLTDMAQVLAASDG